MPNQHLKDALSQAGLTIEQFAEIIEVDPKTVQRWVSGRTPYPRHREKIAHALDLTEHQLWPDAAPTAADTDPDRPGVEEITGLWPAGAEDGAPETIDLLDQPVHEVNIIDLDGNVLAGAALCTALRHQADANHTAIRIITAHNTPEINALADHEQVQIITVPRRASYASFIRVDDTILIEYFLANTRSYPVIRVERCTDHGFFDHLTASFNATWTHFSANDGTGRVVAQQPPSVPTVTPQPRRWPGREQ